MKFLNIIFLAAVATAFDLKQIHNLKRADNTACTGSCVEAGTYQMEHCEDAYDENSAVAVMACVCKLDSKYWETLSDCIKNCPDFAYDAGDNEPGALQRTFCQNLSVYSDVPIPTETKDDDKDSSETKKDDKNTSESKADDKKTSSSDNKSASSDKDEKSSNGKSSTDDNDSKTGSVTDKDSKTTNDSNKSDDDSASATGRGGDSDTASGRGAPSTNTGDDDNNSSGTSGDGSSSARSSGTASSTDSSTSNGSENLATTLSIGGIIYALALLML
ncbi:uncharacterized protein J8A68_004413 [[Candida] subhashii]|uniref:Uncharacterized protein n=1 Tax=[Candida] subhashii TaxID=561895 RepID=A0A8J5QJF0_9ASCO|nr:uncharacterized protein J8A68_004413 [[Candida] subhashii]KAG7662025.1 hypothetical protein J8A68_004413 [[Candida] subhashii]